MQGVGDYIESGYKGHVGLMPGDAYSEALDALVIACVDIFMLFEDKVILGKRDQYPHADWWLFGGRMRTGETLVGSAIRLLRDETSLEIDGGRFSYLTTFATAWNMRAHAPQENGTHTVSVVFVVTLNESEFNRMRLNKEYKKMGLVSPQDIISGDYHPALRQCATCASTWTSAKS